MGSGSFVGSYLGGVISSRGPKKVHAGRAQGTRTPRVVAERRSTPLQQFNDLALFMRNPQMESHRMGGGITYISDGRWDHNPRNSEVRFGFALEHLENKCLYTNASVRAAGMSSYNEAERVNGAETCAAQKSEPARCCFPS